MKNNFYYKKGFTLIELLVMICIIGILSLGISKMSFKKNIDRDKLDTLTSNIYNQLELIRNNSLLGKGVGINLLTPKEYKININNTNSGTINTYFLSGSTFILLDTFETIEKETINNIKCYDLDGQNEGNTLNQLDLMYQGEILTLSGCNSSSNRIFELGTEYKGYKKSIIINSVSGLIHTTSLK